MDCTGSQSVLGCERICFTFWGEVILRESTYCRRSSVAFYFLPIQESRLDRPQDSGIKLSRVTHTLHRSLHRSACLQYLCATVGSPHQAWPNVARGPTGWTSSSLRPGDTEDADLGDATSIISMPTSGPEHLMHLVEKKGGNQNNVLLTEVQKRA